MKQESGSKNQESKPRKSYSGPSLIVYGAVRNLTQSSTGNQSENITWNGQTYCLPWLANRKPCSERRVKENIVRIGDHPFGFGLYLFDYRLEYRTQWGRGRQFGVMIDEVEAIVPEAVCLNSDGYKRVDYGILGIVRLTH